jgi:CheY-like chemotaxis protein
MRDIAWLLSGLDFHSPRTGMGDQTCRGILLVEDDEDIREQMSQILSDEGYRVESAADGRIALERLRGFAEGDRPGCIVLDLMMPTMTGDQLLEILQRDHPRDLGRIPVVIATAKGYPRDERTSLPDHVTLVRKPMDIDELIDAVARHCGRP